MKKIVQIACLLLSMIVITGCHTATKSNWGMKRPVVVDSEPQGAEVLLNGELVGYTPITAMVSPRSGGILTLNYPGYATREVELKAAVWDTSGMATGGNLAATIISPPIGGASMLLDRLVLKMDKDFRLPVIKLYQLPQTFAQPSQHHGHHQPPPEDQSWKPRMPFAPSPFASSSEQQPLNKCCNPAKSIEELEAEHEARIRRR